MRIGVYEADRAGRGISTLAWQRCSIPQVVPACHVEGGVFGFTEPTLLQLLRIEHGQEVGRRRWPPEQGAAPQTKAAPVFGVIGRSSWV